MVSTDPAGAVRVAVRAGELMLSTLIDAADAKRLGDRRLSLGSHGYVQVYWDKQVMLLHRWILGLAPGDRRVGDHINGDSLDNRRANLRAVSASGSSQNVSGSGKSGFRGVYETPCGRWEAKFKLNGVRYHVGTFATREEAALAVDARRREVMPDYAGIRVSRHRKAAARRTTAERERRKAIAIEIRTWARFRGFDVGDVGRIPTRIVAAFELEQASGRAFRCSDKTDAA